MKIVLIMVSSVDGKITRWVDADAYTWTSKEDQDHFEKTRAKATLMVMGRATLDLIRPQLKKGKLRVVMTSNPAKYKLEEVSGQLEFTNEEPRDLVKRLEKKGYKKMLLVGGAGVNTSFFKQGLVDELLLTIEPKIFGKGKAIVTDEELNVRLKLLSIERLNKQGTLLLMYQVDK